MKVKVYYGVLFEAKEKVIEVDDKFEGLNEESELFDKNNYENLFSELYDIAVDAVDYKDIIGIWSEDDGICYFE